MPDDTKAVDVDVSSLDAPAKSWIWMKDSTGAASATVTLVAISFFVTTCAYILSFFEKIGPLTIRPFDVSATSVYFVPILSLYFGRKYTSAKYEPKA